MECFRSSTLRSLRRRWNASIEVATRAPDTRAVAARCAALWEEVGVMVGEGEGARWAQCQCRAGPFALVAISTIRRRLQVSFFLERPGSLGLGGQLSGAMFTVASWRLGRADAG